MKEAQDVEKEIDVEEERANVNVKVRDHFDISKKGSYPHEQEEYSCLESAKPDGVHRLTSFVWVSLQEAFRKYPNDSMDVEQFVKSLTKLLVKTDIGEEEDIVSKIIDLFYRVNHSKAGLIKYDDLSSYLIEQDTSSHNNYIEKIYYFAEIDQVMIFEQGMKIIKVYDAKSMRKKLEYVCPICILGIAYIPERCSLAISVSERKLLFRDIDSNKFIERKIITPDTYHSMVYAKSKRILFTAGLSGAIYAWDLEKIFLNEYKKELTAKGENTLKYKLFLVPGFPWFQKGYPIHDMCDIPDLNLLATAGSDALIRLWNIKEVKKAINVEEKDKPMEEGKRNKIKGKKMMERVCEPVRVLAGHKKGVRGLFYSLKSRSLVSCGFDFDVLVWNLYSDSSPESLKGHEAPLVGVSCPYNTNHIISADSKGVIKIWNIKELNCVQTIFVTNALNVTCITTIPQHRMIVAGCKNDLPIYLARILHLYEYTRPFAPDISNDTPITYGLFSEKRLEFVIAGINSIKVWDARTGRPVRHFDQITDSEITCMNFDEDQRQLIIGEANGSVKIIDSLSGLLLTTLLSHEKEISFVRFDNVDETILVGSYNGLLRIYRDQPDRKKKLRSITKSHTEEMCGMDYSHELNLIATGSRDSILKIWDYERCKLEVSLTMHSGEIVLVRFLDPFPLLFTSDSSGYGVIWQMKSSYEQRYKCITAWQNMFTLTRAHIMTAVDHYYDDYAQTLRLFVGDEVGYIRIMDLTEIINALRMEPLIPDSKYRNPHRIADINGGFEIPQIIYTADLQKEKTKENEIGYKLALEEGIVKQIAQWVAHKDIIKSLHYINVTDEPILFSSSFDKMSKIWNIKGRLSGMLRQGRKIIGEDKWKFDLQHFDSCVEGRKEEAQKILVKAKETRETKRLCVDFSVKDLGNNFMDETDIITSEEVFQNLKELELILNKTRGNEEVKTGSGMNYGMKSTRGRKL